jgi:hypothetical protein
MGDEYKDDITWWKHKVFLLEKRLSELETENYELRKSICESVEKLQQHNHEDRVAIESSENIIRPKFKQAKWNKE